jgi:hypothetical protein
MIRLVPLEAKIRTPKLTTSFIVLAGLLATLCFVALTLGTRFPFIADDYSWQKIALSHSKLEVTDFYTFSRNPINAVLTVFALRNQLLALAPQIFIFFFFAVHAFAFAILFSKIRDYAKTRETDFFCPLAVCILFTLQPNNYEIHLWHLLSIHTVGALIVALSFPRNLEKITTSTWIGLTLGATAAVLTYETFGLLWIGIIGLAWVTARNNRPFPYRALLLSLGTTFALTLMIKLGLKHYTGFLQVIGPQGSLRPWDSFKNIFKTLALIHFYKTNWVSTLLEWIAIGWLAVGVSRSRILSTKKILLLLGLPFLSAAPLMLMTYSAQRAFYGPQILKSLILALLLYSWICIPNHKNKRSWMIPTTLFLLAYLIQWEFIFDIKRKNYKILAAAEEQITLLMDTCQAPCTLRVPPPVPGLSRDQTLPEFVWGEYYEWLHLKHAPNKIIHFQIDQGLKNYDNHPHS